MHQQQAKRVEGVLRRFRRVAVMDVERLQAYEQAPTRDDVQAAL
jgi:hypothetical protein